MEFIGPLYYIILVLYFYVYCFLPLLPLVLFCSSMYTIFRQLLNLFIFNLDIWPSIQQIHRYPIILLIFSKYRLENIVLQYYCQLGDSVGMPLCIKRQVPEHLKGYIVLNSILRHPRQYGTQIVIKGQVEVGKQKLGKVVLDKGSYKDKASIMVICIPLVLQFKQLSNYIHSCFTHGQYSYKLINTK